MADGSQLSNPFSTGGGGVDFENQVQSVFLILMLTGGVAPCLPPWRIAKIKLQGRHAGFRTDDCIVFVNDHNQSQSAKLLAQIKHAVSITQNDPLFGEAIKAAWSDFQDRELFNPPSDAIALITGPLSATDTENARSLLEWARHSESAQEFFENVARARFSSSEKQEKLQAFRSQLQKANGGVDIGDDRLWSFLKCYHLLAYDLDVRSGVILSLLRSHIGQFSIDNLDGIWSMAAREVASFNRNAGTLTLDTLSAELKAAFTERRVETIPFEKVIDKLALLGKHARFTLAFTIMRSNLHEIEKCAELACQVGAHTAVFRPLYPVGTARHNLELMPTFEEYNEALQLLAGLQPNTGFDLCNIDPFSPLAREDTQSVVYQNYGCGAGNLVCSVSVSGDVNPCSFLGSAFVAENIRNKSLAEIWHQSQVFQAMRKLSIAEPSSLHGNDAVFAGGCRARALAFNGSVNAPDPWIVAQVKQEDLV